MQKNEPPFREEFYPFNLFIIVKKIHKKSKFSKILCRFGQKNTIIKKTHLNISGN